MRVFSKRNFMKPPASDDRSKKIKIKTWIKLALVVLIIILLIFQISSMLADCC
tara:strand:- start:435 stop:593 length:159 start_codon:yes stop_codon:yes gene_type:complete